MHLCSIREKTSWFSYCLCHKPHNDHLLPSFSISSVFTLNTCAKNEHHSHKISHRNTLIRLRQGLRRNGGMQPPDEADRSLILMTDVVCISQEGVRSSVCADPLVFPDKERNMIYSFLVVNVSLNPYTGFPILALALPVEKVGIYRIILIHRGRGEILLRFVEVDQEDIRQLIIKIFDTLAEFRRLCFCKISEQTRS